jgi:squalene-associated FAD-dependent desaturase
VSPDDVVIGGGFAGLSAAAALSARGARVVVLEARPSLGGRAAAFVDPATGERVYIGQLVLIGCLRQTFEFLERIGASGGVALLDNLAVDVIDSRGRASRLACPPWPAPLHLIGGVLRWDALDWRDRLAILRIRRAIHGQGMPSGTGVPPPTVREWLRRAGQTPRLVELLWEPLAVAALNEPIDVAAAAPFREVLRRMFTSDRRDSRLGLPVVPLDALYAEPARAFIERAGGVVRTGVRARVVFSGASNRPHVVTPRGESLQPDAVVCAVAWHALPDLFASAPPDLQRVLVDAGSTAASPIVTVNIWLDRPVEAGTFVGLPGRTMQWVFDKGRLFGGGTSHLSLVSSGAGAIVSQSNQALIDLAMGELQGALPRARGATLRRAVVVRERQATFSVAPGVPPRPGTRTAVEGVFLAGDWIDTGLPATIESAVTSGHWAADAVG